MKNILSIIILIAIIIWLLFLTGCSKEMKCGRVQQITKYYDVHENWVRDSVTWDSKTMICGEQFMNYQIMSKRDTILTPECINGIVIGFFKRTIKTY